MVLLYHSIIVFPVNLHEIPWCSALHSFLWKIEMPLFFLVSGFCAFYSFEEKSAGKDRDRAGKPGWNYLDYIRKKSLRILVPHVVFGLLDIVPRSIPNPFVHKQASPKEAIRDFVLYGGSDWFLWVLFLLFLLFPLLAVCCRMGRTGEGIAAAASLILYFFSGCFPEIFLLSAAAKFQAFFVAGHLLRQELYESGQSRLMQRPFVPIVGSLLMGFTLTLQVAEEGTAGMLIFVAGGVLLFLWMAEKSSGSAGRFLMVCGVYSLQMYLLGGYTLVISRTLLVSVLGLTEPAAIIAGNFALNVLLTTGITHFIIRPVKLFRILCGMQREKNF